MNTDVSVRSGSSLGIRSTLLYARDLLSLTKPRVMSLLLVSMACPMILAAGGNVSWEVLLYAVIGSALVTGSASTINCIYDRDIDSLMERTKNRALPTERLSVSSAAIFAFFCGSIGLLLLAIKVNVISAMIALFGHLFYVIVYTFWLKRSTPHNIVIGGAAGAIPPLVGWTAVTGSINSTALLLFLFIFLWTPPHFWALALVKNNDYCRANVPMLPVVSGPIVTLNHMLFYALTLIPTGILLVLSDAHLGIFSVTVVTAIGVLFAYKIYALREAHREQLTRNDAQSMAVFRLSLLYLSLLFACLVIDVLVV